jgi:AAA family ATP:ADP antiporter
VALVSDAGVARRELADRHTLQGAAAFFCILCGYYLLRPLRDELGVRGGVEHLDTLFSLTFVATVAAMAGYVWLSARVARRRIVAVAFAAVCVSLIAFRGALAQGSDAASARALFVWISVINMFLVSGFWSVMSDAFELRSGARRFGLMAAGGTGGALLGPALATVLAPRVAAEDLLLVAAALVGVAAMLLHAVAAGVAADDRTLASAPWRGFARIGTDPRLRGLAGMVVLHAVLSTFVYLLQARLVSEGIDASAQRLRLFAGSDLSINLITCALQLGATTLLLQRAGVVACVLAVPATALLGLASFSAWPVLAVVVVANVLMRVAQFAVTRPARELLFTLLAPVDRYRSRAALDTVVYRASDAAGAWLVSMLGVAGLGAAGVAAVGIPLAAVWLWLSARTASTTIADAGAASTGENLRRT